jgi:hypothetical protein
VSDRWEDGFDTWSARDLPPAQTGDDTGVDLDRDALMRLARELATQRHAEQQQSRDELERLKESLRERAAAVAERERELALLQKRLEGGRVKKQQRQGPAPDTEALAARERAALERLQAVEARERELEAHAAELEAEASAVAERESALVAELAAAREELSRSEADRRLAAAERQRLEERLEEARRTERELVARRLELEQERASIAARERRVAAGTAAVSDDTQPGPWAEREQELPRLAARLEARERELALQRQGLDAQRNELYERERALRRREVVEVRQAFGPPLAPPRFGEGLAAFVSSRRRR